MRDNHTFLETYEDWNDEAFEIKWLSKKFIRIWIHSRRMGTSMWFGQVSSPSEMVWSGKRNDLKVQLWTPLMAFNLNIEIVRMPSDGWEITKYRQLWRNRLTLRRSFAAPGTVRKDSFEDYCSVVRIKVRRFVLVIGCRSGSLALRPRFETSVWTSVSGNQKKLLFCCSAFSELVS
jgi:hypothetical protein